MKAMSSLFINACYQDGQYLLDIKSFICFTLYKLSKPCGLKLKVRILKEVAHAFIAVNLDNVIFEHTSETIELAELCTWPIIILNNNHVVSGMCSVARQLCRASQKDDIKKLLGFREACLVACAESSVWTKFCEIDITYTINDLLSNQYIQDNNCFILPSNILKYENHLSQPVRIHNIYKIARNNNNDQSLQSSTPRKDLRVAHDYAEGPYITLADLILYPCFQVFFKYLSKLSSLVESKIPLIASWFNRLSIFNDGGFGLQISLNKSVDNIMLPQIDNVSLYKADPTRALGIRHTKQHKIESGFNLIAQLKHNVKNSVLPFGYDKRFDWKDVPLEANPLGGALPAKRADRKCEQLENMAKAVMAVASDRKYRIVDFCSGSGHLGILIATLLPNCQVILVENKERSLARAKETTEKLNLTNTIVVQSNLDYFKGTFDLGMALHACGVATDLVLQMCIKNQAHFVCCPCCYGGIKDCHEVTYPRSVQFQEAFADSKDHYFNLAHAADQTHEQDNCKTQQGYFCMDVIDTDRKFYAEHCGYSVHLGKLQPVTCTNKNNLLVGNKLYGNVAFK